MWHPVKKTRPAQLEQMNGETLMSERNIFMAEAVGLSLESVAEGSGPFGAVVVLDGRVVGRGRNRVTVDLDPTAHAEIAAIRDACRNLNRYDLTGCEMYASCQPCPMCLSAAYWARIGKIWYANTTAQAAQAGFDDLFIYDEFLRGPEQRRLPVLRLDDPEAAKAFRLWSELENRQDY